jgi:coenzyme F420-0:L-glutamate ligase/coenzyme F420-1:gamma-L-glutamate ligase
MNVELMAIEGLPEFGPGDDIAALLADGAARTGVPLVRGDILVVTQKIVSKAEGQLVPLSSVTPSPFAAAWAGAHGYDPRLVELVLRESRRIVKMDQGLLITETLHGLVCANAGVDVSNVSGGEVATVLPRDPDASACRIREALVARLGHDVAVVISDTFGRPWREGLVNVAIGVAGFRPLSSYVDARDPAGFALKATVQALADEVAAASGLVARKLNRVPAVVVRGVSYEAAAGDGGAKELIRPAERDHFR